MLAHGKASLKGVWLSHVNHLNFGGHNHISGTADRLRCCQLSSPVSIHNSFHILTLLDEPHEIILTASGYACYGDHLRHSALRKDIPPKCTNAQVPHLGERI